MCHSCCRIFALHRPALWRRVQPNLCLDTSQGGRRLPRGLGGGSRNLGEARAVDVCDERADPGAAAAVLALPPQAAGVLGRRVDGEETGEELDTEP